MRPLSLRVSFLLAMAGVVHAGQVGGPISAEIAAPGAQSGSIGASLGAPSAIQLSVPSLTGAMTPSLAAPIAAAPGVVQPAVVTPLAASPLAIPALPGSAVTPALSGKVRTAPAATDEPGGGPPKNGPDSGEPGEAGAERGREFFDQGRATPGGTPAVRGKKAGAADTFFSELPDGIAERLDTDRSSPLRQMQISLEARGKGAVFKEAEAILYTDGLTGLPNRAFIMARAEALLKGVKEPTVAMLDMNNFGAVNAGLADVHGPVRGKAMGDGMLAYVGPKISEIARRAGVHAARLGGEEIVVFGSINNVIDFSAAMRQAFPPDRILTDAKVGADGGGLAPGGAERTAIDAAMVRMQRTGPVGDFTYGLAKTEGRAFDAALKDADSVLNEAKAGGLRGEAVMKTPGAVSFTRLREISALARRIAEEGESAAPVKRPVRLEEIKALKEKLTAQEYAVFIEAVYKDPLTLTKNAEWIDMERPRWEADYDGKGTAAMISARNFKAVNDVLGHAAGDRYLKRLGVIARVEINRLRKLGYSVEEPVRVGGKEFLIVGRDAAEVARLVDKKFASKLASGAVLPADQLERLRTEAVARGMIPKARASHLGTLRAIDEPFAGGFDKTFERLILKLEAAKLREENAP